MKKLLLSILFISWMGVSILMAQTKPKTTTAVATEIPKISITLGGYKGGNITSDIFSQLVDSSLTARDARGSTYPIVRFRLLYRFKSSYEDPETGQKRTVNDMRANDFDSARMSELWAQSIKDNITTGDEITLDNIIVKLKNGTKVMAPALSFKVL